MSWVVGATIWFVIWVICLWLVWRMVDRKDLNRALWIILCIFFPIVILIIVAILPAKQRATPPFSRTAAASRQYLPTSFQIQRCGACMLMPGLLYITAQ